MTALMVLCLIFAAVMFILGCMDQRKVYWKTTAWRYRNPEANEPSDTALSLNRFGLFVCAVMMVAVAAMIGAADGSPSGGYSTSQVKSVASAVASRLESGTESGIGSSVDASSNVFDAVNEEGDGNVEVDSMGGDEYELTNRDGENPVCLTVTVENDLDIGAEIDGDGPWSHSVSTSVNEGPC